MELYIKGQKADLAPDAVFAVTVQSNDITKPDTVQSSYSNTLTLPYTNRNNALLDNANDPRSIGSAPYQKLEAQVLQDGVEVVPLPKVYLQQASEGYELQIFSGAVDFFERLGDKSIRDLDLSAFDHAWTYDNQSQGSYNTRTYADGYIYDVIDRGKPFEAKTNYASVFVRAVWERLFTENGLKYEGFGIPQFDELTLPFSNDYPRHTQEWVDAHTLTVDWTTPFNLLPITTGKAKGTFRFFVERATTMYATSITVVVRNGTDPLAPIVREQKQDIVGTGWMTVTMEVDFPYGENIANYTWRLAGENISFTAGDDDPSRSVITDRECTVTFEDEAYFSTFWNTALNLPDISQKDFFKAIAAMFNLMPSFDPYGNTMRLTPMQVLEANKAKAHDWTDKLVKVGPVPVQYRFGEFAQRSWFRYKKDERSASGDHYLTINDEQLEKEKNVVELPFAASEERGGLLYMPMFEQDDEGKWKRVKVEPRIAVLRRDYMLSLARSEFAPLSFENLLSAYFSVLQGILDSCKGITPYFLLTAQDVQNYDCSIPVWLDQYQSYFYLNSINEFTGKEPTECHLWRL